MSKTAIAAQGPLDRGVRARDRQGESMAITSKVTGKKIGCVGHDCDDCRRNRNALQREARAMRTALTRLSNAVLMYLHAMDTTVGPNKEIPRSVSEWLGKTCGSLELQNDLARQALGVAFSAEGKAKALKKLMRSNAPNADATT